jgi:hypothetical protein
MHHTARTALVSTAVATVLLGAGCSSVLPGVPAPEPVGSSNSAAATGSAPVETDGVAWMDKICGAMLPAVQVRATAPTLGGNGDPQSRLAGLSQYLDKASTAVDGAITGMAAAGPSPIEGGDQAVTALTTTLTSFRDSAREAKTKIDAVDTSDPQALRTDLPAAIAPLAELASLPNPAAQLDSNPALEAAAKAAPQCQQVEGQIN